MAEGNIKTKGIVPEGQDEEQVAKTSTYQMYWDYTEPLSQVKPHRIQSQSNAHRRAG